jgi:hypothetical protein
VCRYDRAAVRRASRPLLSFCARLGLFALGAVAIIGEVSIMPGTPASATVASAWSASTANPPSNIAPCSSTWLAAIDCARVDEGIGPVPVAPSALDSMTVPEQLFTLTDYERVARGLPPFTTMTTRVDSTAQVGANEGGDPPLGSLDSGAWAGGVWAGGLKSAAEAMYEWMYADGLFTPSGGGNVDCQQPGDSGCWHHRDNILRAAQSCSTGKSPALALGAATNRSVDGGSMAMTLLISCSGVPGAVTYTWAQAQARANGRPPPGSFVALAPTPFAGGYWQVTSTGAVHAFGSAPSFGTLADKSLAAPIVGMAATPDGKGYWLVSSDGGIFAFGDASFHGSAGGRHLVEPVVGMAVDPSTGGYWLVAADGGIFSFDAPFYGSIGGHPLVQPITGMAAARGGKGYWLVARDGGVFTFGDASFHGSAGGHPLTVPVVGMATDAATGGYWLVARDGGIFSFDAPFLGSMGGQPGAGEIVAMAALPSGSGYWMSGATGGIFAFGAAPTFGPAA